MPMESANAQIRVTDAPTSLLDQLLPALCRAIFLRSILSAILCRLVLAA